MLAPLVTPKDKTPIKLLTLAFFPLNSMLTSDLKEAPVMELFYCIENTTGLTCGSKSL